ncbi:MAG: glucose 1-dehydrogenase [Alphaproteobacteria bacterium]|nr:glucose 1-dehydrogenase [Alphaproteobacteria bacterium]
MQDLNGSSAIVTGGGTGLGAAVARGLAMRGANVCVNYASSAEAAEAVVRECVALGVRALAVQADVGEDADCRRLVASAVEALGGADILVNNAGVTKFASYTDFDALDADDFLRLYRINVVSMYQMARAARPHLEANGRGAIVNVSSIAGVTGVGSSIAYAATKGAINTMTLSLARALAPKIRVNAVCPGYIASGWFTRHNGAVAETERSERAIRDTPLKVASTPDDVAETVLFLAGPASRHVTGETLLIDGGAHLGFSPLVAR